MKLYFFFNEELCNDSSLVFFRCLLLSFRGLGIHLRCLIYVIFNENGFRLQNSDTGSEFIQEPFASPECQLMGVIRYKLI